MKTENLFVGGPYNGNSFYVLDEDDTYEIASAGGAYYTQHVYARTGQQEFTYKETRTE